MASTPAQVRPLSTASTHREKGSAPASTHAGGCALLRRCSAQAHQRCIHACGGGGGVGGGWGGGDGKHTPLKCTRSALHPRTRKRKRTCSSAPAQHCIHACGGGGGGGRGGGDGKHTPLKCTRSALHSTHAKEEAHLLKRTRSALHPRNEGSWFQPGVVASCGKNVWSPRVDLRRASL